jgi:hypothetical protein
MFPITQYTPDWKAKKDLRLVCGWQRQLKIVLDALSRYVQLISTHEHNNKGTNNQGKTQREETEKKIIVYTLSKHLDRISDMKHSIASP